MEKLVSRRSHNPKRAGSIPAPATPLFRVLSQCRGGGYLYARTEPKHPKANAKGLYPLHRVLAENQIGRLLACNEVVHHIDGDKTNNSLDNLEVMLVGDHNGHHKRIELVDLTCPWCEKAFSLRPCDIRRRGGRSKLGTICCSRQCGTMMGHLV